MELSPQATEGVESIKVKVISRRVYAAEDCTRFVFSLLAEKTGSHFQIKKGLLKNSFLSFLTALPFVYISLFSALPVPVALPLPAGLPPGSAV